ncbi:MAG TPA: hypothetical protein VNI61_03450 [Gemmatimonadales bacterium]|nr:hypothetical protein [Gemmatimonadales bacterium]
MRAVHLTQLLAGRARSAPSYPSAGFYLLLPAGGRDRRHPHREDERYAETGSPG